jgi:hypothetical protein
MMVLVGDLGAVHFIFGTGIFLEKTMVRLITEDRIQPKIYDSGHYFSVVKPMGHDVGTHSPKPQFEGHQVTRPTKMVKTGEGPFDIDFVNVGEIPNCEWIGAPCYCDGSAMLAEEWLNILISEGSDKIWEMLEERYKDEFGELV